jgi:hypothetical protein
MPNRQKIEGFEQRKAATLNHPDSPAKNAAQND